MILRRFRQRQNSRHLRLRVESCVNTILALNESLGEGKIKPEIIQQFEQLKDSLQYVDDENVDEKDIFRIEEATNQLLEEIRTSFEDKDLSLSHEGQTH
jgi:hypothetical protein